MSNAYVKEDSELGQQSILSSDNTKVQSHLISSTDSVNESSSNSSLNDLDYLAPNQESHTENLSQGIYSFLEQSISKFQEAFEQVQTSQNQLSTQLTLLNQGITSLSKIKDSPVDLEPYITVLQNYKQRITKVHNSLLHSQDRVNHLRQIINRSPQKFITKS